MPLPPSIPNPLDGMYFPGDFVLEDVTLISASEQELSIADILLELNVYEDLFSPVISGNVIVFDANNLISRFPIVGQEHVRIKFRTAGKRENINVTLRVYKIERRSQDNDRTATYQLDLVSPEQITNLQTRISQSFTGTVSVAVEAILATYLPSVLSDWQHFVEPTKFLYRFIIPNWHPFVALNWLAKRSVSAVSNDANFLFYQNTRGFVFSSIGSLVNPQLVSIPAQTYIYQIPNVRSSGFFLPPGRDVASDFANIESFEIMSAFDVLQNIISGLYASTLITHDIVTKTWNKTEFNYLDSYTDYTHIEANRKFGGQGITAPVYDYSGPLGGDRISDHPDSVIFLYPKHKSLYDGSLPVMEQNHVEDWLPARASQIQQTNGFKVRATAAGDSDRRVGEVVEFVLPSSQPVTDDTRSDRIDPLYSGRYLITSLRHKINKSSYKIVFEMVKDSLASPLS